MDEHVCFRDGEFVLLCCSANMGFWKKKITFIFSIEKLIVNDSV